MITFEEALSIIRNKHPNDLIRAGFTFEENYYFFWSFGKDYIENDLFVGLGVVNGETGSYRDAGYMFECDRISQSGKTERLDSFVAAANSAKLIDLPKDP